MKKAKLWLGTIELSNKPCDPNAHAFLEAGGSPDRRCRICSSLLLASEYEWARWHGGQDSNYYKIVEGEVEHIYNFSFDPGSSSEKVYPPITNTKVDEEFLKQYSQRTQEIYDDLMKGRPRRWATIVDQVKRKGFPDIQEMIKDILDNSQ